MIRRSLFRPARIFVLGLAATLLVPYSAADNIITGLNAGAGAYAAILNQSGYAIYQAPYGSDSHQVLRDPSVTSLSASTSASTGLFTQSQNVIIDTNGDIQQIGWQAAATASGTATASYGALHASATGFEQEDPGSFTYMYWPDNSPPQAYTLVTPLGARGNGSANAGYTDKFTVTSSTLADGTAVQALFTFTLDGTTHMPLAAFNQPIEAYYDFEPNNFNSPTELAHLYITNTASVTSVTVAKTLYVGEVFGISGQLSVYASTPTDCTPPVCNQQTLTSDAQNTSKTFIDIQTRGVSLDTFSGHNYATPTSAPEPSPLTLLASGIGGLALLLRRPRR